MTCHDARELFSGWADDALTPEERAHVEAHLAGCAECQRELQRFTATVALLRRVEPPRAPAGFVDRVLAAARPTPWYRRLLERLFLPLPAKLPAEAVALLLVAGLAVYVFQRTPELQQAAVPSASQPAARPAAPSAAAPSPGSPSPGKEARPSGPERRPEERGTGVERRHAVSAVDVAKEAAPERMADRPTSPEPPAPATGTGTPAFRVERGIDTRKEAVGVSPPAPGPPPPPTESRPAPAREKVADARRDTPERSARAVPQAPPVLPPADVVGRLRVKDRSAAEQALGLLLARHGGVVISRRDDAGSTLVDVTVPGTEYPEFRQGLARLGAWHPEGEASQLPSDVRVTLRLVE
jgi:hypothetical protein